MARDNEAVLPRHSKDLRHSKSRQSRSEDEPHHHNFHHPHLPGHHGKHARRKANLTKKGIPTYYRNEAIAFIAELSGTFMFLLFAFVGTQVANQAAEATTGNAVNGDNSLSQAPNATTLQYIALSFGFSLTINVWIFFRISGGLFNPVVSLFTYIQEANSTLHKAISEDVKKNIEGSLQGTIETAVLKGIENKLHFNVLDSNA